MNKKIVLLIALMIIFSLIIGCQSNTGNNNSMSATNAQIQRTLTVVVQDMTSSAESRTQEPTNAAINAQDVSTDTESAEIKSLAVNTTQPRITSTDEPRNTARPTNTFSPTNTPRPTRINTTTYYVTGSTANVRACSNTTCEVLEVVSFREAVEVIEEAEGASVGGSTVWYRILLEGEEEGFIHSSLLSTRRPAANSQTSSGGGSGSSSNNPQPTTIPQEQAPQAPVVEPTELPIFIQQTQPPIASYACDCSKTCEAMSCEEAYFQLNQCGCSRRDGDSDGVPCESICSGG